MFMELKLSGAVKINNGNTVSFGDGDALPVKTDRFRIQPLYNGEYAIEPSHFDLSYLGPEFLNINILIQFLPIGIAGGILTFTSSVDGPGWGAPLSSSPVNQNPLSYSIHSLSGKSKLERTPADLNAFRCILYLEPA